MSIFSRKKKEAGKLKNRACNPNNSKIERKEVQIERDGEDTPCPFGNNDIIVTVKTQLFSSIFFNADFSTGFGIPIKLLRKDRENAKMSFAKRGAVIDFLSCKLLCETKFSYDSQSKAHKD